MARSQHKCQGFGQLTTRGSTLEYLELLKGDVPSDKTDLFEGINTTWTRIDGGEAIGKLLVNIENNFNFSNPAAHIKDLAQAYKLLQEVKDNHWKKVKSAHLKEILMAVSGLYVEANPASSSAVPGEKVSVTVEAVNRSEAPLTLTQINFGEDYGIYPLNTQLKDNIKFNTTIDLTIPENSPYTSAYWLKEQGTLGMYVVNEQNLIGKPETPSAIEATFEFTIAGVPIDFNVPVKRRFSTPDFGERFEPFVILPKVTTSFNEEVLIFDNSEAKMVAVNVTAGTDAVNGTVAIEIPKDWKLTPAIHPFELDKKGATTTVNFQVTPPANQSEGFLTAKASIGEKEFDKELIEIDYNYIPKQRILLPSTAKVVRLNIEKKGNHIGYIVGAGDKVPESLRQIGYQVSEIDVESMQASDLDDFDGIVVGIRAYNVVSALQFKQELLFDYVEKGGTMIVQYNTAGRWAAQFENIAPYPISISRDRVTDELAPVKIIAPNHELMQRPNKISNKDFEGWVQERGLYFPNKWDENFTPILEMNDKGETPKQGSLLVAQYGKGHYIYTGLSFLESCPLVYPAPINSSLICYL